MAPPVSSSGAKKRKPSVDSPAPQSPSKRPRAAGPADPTQPNGGQTQSPLQAPHAPILRDLAAKYDVLPLSIISSTAIAKRLVQSKEHLRPNDTTTPSDETKPKVVLFYARTAEVCKMITVVEQCKRLLADQGGFWWQYNQMFDLPADQLRLKKTKNSNRKTVDGVDVTVVEETKLPEEDAENVDSDSDSDSASDAFETMRDRFEKAVGPRESERKTKSLRIFLSTIAVPEVRGKEGVTVQSSQDS